MAEEYDDNSTIKLSRHLQPPVELFSVALEYKDSPEVTYFGESAYKAYEQEEKLPFALKDEDRTQHVYVIGKSGVGKSKFIESIAMQDIANNKALIVIDPHGDLIEDLLKHIPSSRADDLCLIEPSEKDYAVAFNPLANISQELKHRVVQDLIEVMKKQFKERWSAKIEHVFRFSLLALLDYPEATFEDIIKLLTDKDFRQEVIEYIQDDFVKRFWATEFSGWSKKFDSEAITPLVNKIGAFLSDEMIRNIFTQKQNKVDFFKLMNENKIILINLAKGKLGEENTSFLGSIFLTKIKQAGMERAFVPKEKRNKVFLYIDEFQNLVTDTFESLLAESRKFGFSMLLAHQYLSQIPENILQAIFGNASTIISFRLSGHDAKIIKDEFAPLLQAKDIMNLGKRNYYIKTIIDGETYNPFSAQTLFVPEPNTDPEYIAQLKRLSVQKYYLPVKKQHHSKKPAQKKKSNKTKPKEFNDNDIEPII